MKSIDEIRIENLVTLMKRGFSGSQTALSMALGQDRPTQVNHWLRGVKRLSTASARGIEVKLGLPPHSMDQPGFIAGLGPSGYMGTRDYALDRADKHLTGKSDGSEAFGSNGPLTAVGEVFIAAHHFNGVPGESDQNTADEAVSGIYLSQAAAARLLSGRPSERVRLMTMPGDSMVPTIDPQDVTIIDLSVTKFQGDGIYVFQLGDVLFLRRLQMSGSKIAVLADNSKYSAWIIEEFDIDHFKILGRVLSAIPLHAAKVFS